MQLALANTCDRDSYRSLQVVERETLKLDRLIPLNVVSDADMPDAVCAKVEWFRRQFGFLPDIERLPCWSCEKMRFHD